MASTIPEWRIGHRLALARESAGLSVEDMARLLRVERHTITNYEKHHGRKRGVPHAVVLVYAQATNVPATWIEHGEKHEEHASSTKWSSTPRVATLTSLLAGPIIQVAA